MKIKVSLGIFIERINEEKSLLRDIYGKDK